MLNRYRLLREVTTRGVLITCALLCLATWPNRGLGAIQGPPADYTSAAGAGDLTVRDFHFHTGEVLPELRLHYVTWGRPVRNAAGDLFEEFVFDKATGVKLSTNMFEYKKPTILDITPTDPILVESRASNACYGGSGISHAMATTQLLVCAVANAIGKWIAPPVTPDKVLKALGKI